MKEIAIRLSLLVLLAAVALRPCHAQGGSNSSLSGSIVDQDGKAVAGAQIRLIHHGTSAEYQAVAAKNGTFTIPALGYGTYAGNVSATGFKQAVVRAIKVDAGIHATLRIVLQAGSQGESVVMDAGAGLIHAQSGTVTSTLSAGQIAGLPTVTRDATDLLIVLPGINTTAGPRLSTLTGLPNAAVNITIDGINTQDNYDRSAYGLLSGVSPRLDAVEEVAVSIAAQGAEASNEGAVQVRFVTRSGSGAFHGSLYEYHRNSYFNANYWFANRDLMPPVGTWTPDWKAPKPWFLFNQFGGRVGGPLGPWQDRAFFFVNYEEFRWPSSIIRYRTILGPSAEKGIFQYTSYGLNRQVDLLALAASVGQTSTLDPTIEKLLGDIRRSTAEGAVSALNDPNYQSLTFTSKQLDLRRFPTARFDLNLTRRHRLEVSGHYSEGLPTGVPGAGQPPSYPGFPNFGSRVANRFTGSAALRSVLSASLVNEARGGVSGGNTLVDANADAATFSGPVANQDGFALDFGVTDMDNAYVARTPSRRNAPVQTLKDTLSWIRGSHTLSVGGSYTNWSQWAWSQTVAPLITLGMSSTYDPARIMFDATNGFRYFPGASSSQISDARSLYAVLTGRITAIGGYGVLDEAAVRYVYNGPQVERARQREAAVFAADSWRLRPGWTLTTGLRWEVQFPFEALNQVYAAATPEDLWGVSGPGNLFQPGTLAGSGPLLEQFVAGSKAYRTDYRTLAPSFGFAWSPAPKGGLLHFLFGDAGRTVFRGGYAIAFYRYDLSESSLALRANSQLSVLATRSDSFGNLAGAGTHPVLFRDKSRLGPPALPEPPAYPRAPLSSLSSVHAFDPNLRSPYVQSWAFGIQREVAKNTVLEVRYTGMRNLQPRISVNLNEVNIVENGFLDEFGMAMANLQANVANNRGYNFRYYGPGTGTYPLPITLAHFSGVPLSQAGDASKYNSSYFTSSTALNLLAKSSPNPYGYQDYLTNDAMRRTNALNAGLPANFFVVNPDVARGGAWLETNGGYDRYDALMVDVRRRMARDLVVQANYTFAKSFSGERYSFRTPWGKALGATLPHAGKVNWIYELPFGRGQAFASGSPGVVEHLIGGWGIRGTGRWQSGNLLDFGYYRLVGMTLKELQHAAGLRFDDPGRRIYYYPADILDNTIRAFNTSATSSTGYSSYGVPTGRYVAPANSADCIEVARGDCAAQRVFVRGPKFVRFDASIVKRVRFSDSKNLEVRGEFLNVMNHTNFYGVVCASGSLSCGMVTSAYSDLAQTEDTGARQIQLVLRFTF